MSLYEVDNPMLANLAIRVRIRVGIQVGIGPFLEQ